MPCFSQIPVQSRVIWAKSGEAGGHGLLAHMLDVAATVESLLASEPQSTIVWASDRLEMSSENVPRWLACMVGLHDFGKAIPGFQQKWDEGCRADQAAGLEFPPVSCRVDQHSCATAALLEDALLQVWPDAGDWLVDTVSAVSAHHGRYFLQSEVDRGTPMSEPIAWAQARQLILEIYLSILALPEFPTVDSLSFTFSSWLAGLTSTADWIASNPKWFPLGERRDDLNTYFQHSHVLAQLALREIGWSGFRGLQAEALGLSRVLRQMTGLDGIAPRPLQVVGDELLQQSQGPSLLMVEAPMGEGKTELAFLATLRLQQKNLHRGLYVAMPTQATGNAMFLRTCRFLEAFTEQHTDIQLLHGGAFLNEALEHLHKIDVQRLQGVDDSIAESVSASAWFGQRKRPLLSPYGVGTVDQALYAILAVKHHFVRLWGLGNRVVVLDEVHAYDTYTHSLITTLLKWLCRLGSSVVLMSATLPASRRDELVRAWTGNLVAVRSAPSYPRLTLADSTGVRTQAFEAQRQSSLLLASVDESLDALEGLALELLSNGGCGAIIVNTVDRAQRLYQSLARHLDDQAPLILFHARFPADQRVSIEQRVLGLFGLDGQRPTCALLIATQVAEQSLDLDFDFMISDLAPVDLLLQRAGRLHRHDRIRPVSHQQACLWVAGLLSDRMPQIKETKWAYVYDPLILLRTWAFLKDLPVLQLPVDIDRWVQAVYDQVEPLPVDLDRSISDHIEVQLRGEHIGRNQQERQLAADIALDPQEDTAYAYAKRPRGHETGEGRGLENQTRLGPDSVTLIPVWEDATGWCIRPGDPAFDPTRAVLDDPMARALYARQIRISRNDLVQHFQGQESVACFANHPWLRDMYPLVLQAGCCVIEGQKIVLDEELGLMYDMSPDRPH